MKDWNDALRAGVDIRALADKARAYKPKLNGSAQHGPHLVVRCAEEIEPEPIDWIWEGRIARGKLTVIGGDRQQWD
ncbi:MAG: hypothetical protein ACRD3W_09645 [Terriglobales bacterium]